MSYDSDKEKVKLEAAVFENQYFSVGFGEGMHNTDMIIFEAKGDGKVYDTYSTGYSSPPPDS